MKTKMFLAGLLTAVGFTSAASAQVIYMPVRYQYGRNNEVYYGGLNPNFAINAQVYAPPAIQTAHTPGAGPVIISPYGTYISPAPAEDRIRVYSDALPYQEASQFGYTPDDARNEAYANVPRVQGVYHITPAPAPVEAAAPVPAPVAASTPVDPKIKAIPLLNWAKREAKRNPELYKAIMDEARKLDANATLATETAIANEK